MIKKTFWRQDWFAGLLISLVFLFFAQNEFIQGLERSAYDFGVRSSQKEPGEQIVIIAIDDQSLEKLGRWPWPRNIIADIIRKLSDAGARVIGNTILMSEAQSPPESVQTLIDYVESATLIEQDQALANLTGIAKADLNKDSKLAESYKTAGNIVLGMTFQLSQPLGNQDDDQLPEFIQKTYS